MMRTLLWFLPWVSAIWRDADVAQPTRTPGEKSASAIDPKRSNFLAPRPGLVPGT